MAIVDTEVPLTDALEAMKAAFASYPSIMFTHPAGEATGRLVERFLGEASADPEGY